MHLGTGETAPTLEEHMAKKTRLEPIPDAKIVPLPTRPLSERAVQAMRSQSVCAAVFSACLNFEFARSCKFSTVFRACAALPH